MTEVEEYLQFVSVEKWTMIFTWANLLILFLLLKKFFFKPVNKVLSDRAAEIESEYKKAENVNSEALSFKSEYENKLLSAESEAENIIKSAVKAASARSEKILGEADESAKRLAEKSRKQIETDREKALAEARRDIASMAVDIAEKVVGKRFSSEEDEKLISDIIDRI